jgi:hypothetical protein
MKSIQALNIMKREGLVNKNCTLNRLKWIRRNVYGVDSWSKLIQTILAGKYILEDLFDPIIIPEIPICIGGEQVMEIHNGKVTCTGIKNKSGEWVVGRYGQILTNRV